MNIVMNLDCFVSILAQCTHVYVYVLYFMVEKCVLS